jgi:hypothetical protein
MFLFLLKLNFFWHSQALKSEGKKCFVQFENAFQTYSNLTLGEENDILKVFQRALTWRLVSQEQLPSKLTLMNKG